jgi:hypothetical protein
MLYKEVEINDGTDDAPHTAIKWEPDYEPDKHGHYPPPKEFVEDRRKDNPGLHMHYVKTAVGHLMLIDNSYKSFCEQSNFNVYGFIEAIKNERLRLCTTNAAYWDANEILDSIGLPSFED